MFFDMRSAPFLPLHIIEYGVSPQCHLHAFESDENSNFTEVQSTTVAGVFFFAINEAEGE